MAHPLPFIKPLKRLSQNFLVCSATQRKIARILEEMVPPPPQVAAPPPGGGATSSTLPSSFTPFSHSSSRTPLALPPLSFNKFSGGDVPPLLVDKPRRLWSGHDEDEKHEADADADADADAVSSRSSFVHPARRSPARGPPLNVLEVGPGTGALTIPFIYRLMEEGHDAVLTLVELDERVIDPLLRRLDDALTEAEAARLPGRLAINLLQGDALAVTQHPAWSSSFDLIYGNLPFNISTQLLVSWLNHGIAGSLADAPDLALVMQREVGMRCVARPNDSARSRLSVMSQIAHQPRLCATLPPGVFRPIPKVHSTLVHFAPLDERLAPGADLRALQPIVRELFHHRRKMIGKAAQRVWDGDGEAARAWLARADVRPDQRAQELTNAQWCNLATDETLRSVSMWQSSQCEAADQALL